MSTLYSLLVSLTVTFGMSIVLLRRIEVKTRSRKMMDELRSEIGGVIVEMNASTDRNIQLIEDRIQQLKEIIATADSRIQLLNAELAKAKKGDELYVQLRGSKRGAPMTTAAAVGKQSGQSSDTPVDSTLTDNTMQKDTGESSQEVAEMPAAGEPSAAEVSTGEQIAGEQTAGEQTAGEQTAGETVTEEKPTAKPGFRGDDTTEQSTAGQVPLRMRVWEMYAAGEKIERIAARIGRTEGEVELMISLLPKDET